MNKKRIFAMIGVILLAAMYLTTLILAFCDFPGSDRLLTGFVLLDVAAPIFLWIMLYIYKRFSDKEE